MTQKIVNIEIEKLHLWSENPRDPVDTGADDEAIISRALSNDAKKWNLAKLLQEMGSHYDFSELPTVVKIDGQYVVYDGNRRIAVLKYVQNRDLYAALGGGMFPETEPEALRNLTTIPCNVCDSDTALTNVERKHTNSGSWGQLERDYFAYKHRGKDKSLFVRLDEQTGGYIGRHKSMNQLFVKDEVLNAKNLRDVGFRISDSGELESPYTSEQSLQLLDNIRELIEGKNISTRNNRGALKQPLLDKYPDVDIKTDADSKELEPLHIDPPEGDDGKEQKGRKTPRTKKKQPTFFLDNMPSLVSGEVNDIYRDILSLHDYYVQQKSALSPTFPALVRMSLRLLVESASGTDGIAKYIKDNYADAKKSLTQDQKTTLSSNSIDGEQKLIQLLQSGAHNYANSANFDQTVAMSIIIGAIISKTHQKEKDSKK